MTASSDQGTTLEDWNGRAVAVARSRGGVIALSDFSDNLIRSGLEPWPPPPVVQKLYESRQSRAFDPPALHAVTAKLGVYSDLQSIHSEDAVTWSYFGPLAAQDATARAAFLNWLIACVGLAEWAASESASIDLWRRVPHPDKSLPGGPELDFVIDGDRCVVFGEVKWRSGEGRGQGIGQNKGQMQLRREFFSKYGRAIYGDRRFLVLGVAISGDLEADTPADTDAVATRTVSWGQLAGYDEHPAADEFARYLAWKTRHTRGLRS